MNEGTNQFLNVKIVRVVVQNSLHNTITTKAHDLAEGSLVVCDLKNIVRWMTRGVADETYLYTHKQLIQNFPVLGLSNGLHNLWNLSFHDGFD